MVGSVDWIMVTYIEMCYDDGYSTENCDDLVEFLAWEAEIAAESRSFPAVALWLTFSGISPLFPLSGSIEIHSFCLQYVWSKYWCWKFFFFHGRSRWRWWYGRRPWWSTQRTAHDGKFLQFPSRFLLLIFPRAFIPFILHLPPFPLTSHVVKWRLVRVVNHH